ncbi:MULTISPECIES: DUF2529 family protein [Shouchella]|uniref:DUF2529 family protein n=2 Tax=Shouchella TaxID=2893057 RepID=A0ABY7W833_9BACI|nr:MULTISPECIES: DUF2529 family protein [Shouchella]MED4128279.1 DUF2529 family protein [Shouchella miscanthi]WDF05087.1 DUF2529 family protein [Shouchella hunanensis]GAF21489.1 hypothetical protein JCM19047_1173 [Bacillus sp. JCM 19047]
MDKIYTTQLIGLLKKINDTQPDELENAARLLSQSIMANGTIYVKGIAELKALEYATTASFESLPNGVIYSKQSFSSTDRFLLFSPDASDSETKELLKVCNEESVPVVLIVTGAYGGSEVDADSLIELGLTKGLTPNEQGERVGHPGLIATLFMYNQLYLNTLDIVNELKD